MADPALGTKSTVVVDYETSWNVPKITPAAFQLAILNWQISPSQELLDNATLRGDFNTNDFANGKIAASGAASLYPTLKIIPWFQKTFFGNDTVTGGPTYTHVSKITGQGPTSFISEVKYDIGGTLRYARSGGTRINKLTIPIDSTGLSPWNMDLMARTVAIGSSAYDAAPTDWRAGTPLDFLQIASANITIDASPVGYISKGSIDIEASLFGTDYRVGGAAARGSLVPGRHKVSGSLDLVLDDVAVLALIQSGTTPVAISVTWTQGSYSFTIEIPRAFIQQTGPTLKDDGPVFITAQFKASYDSIALSELVFTTVNDQAGAVYV